MKQESVSTNPESQSQSPLSVIGGPQFVQSDGWGAQIKGWLNRYGSTVVLPIIAILILVGGVYLYTKQRHPSFEQTPEQVASVTEVATSTSTEEVSKDKETKPDFKKLNIVAEGDRIEKITSESPKTKTETGEIFTEKAQKGDGVTHLARRALKEYLQKHPHKDLTKEHKIYIEDYLKDKTGSRPLAIGEEISFSADLIEEAINASQKLNSAQLKNLEKYSARVSSW